MLGVTTNGDPLNQLFHGGLPWSFCEALNESGLEFKSIDCTPYSTPKESMLMRAKYLLNERHSRGMQYSKTYQEVIQKKLIHQLKYHSIKNVISFYPLLSPLAQENISNIDSYFYIDATADQIIDNYGGPKIKGAQRDEIIQRQRTCLERATKIFCRNNWVYGHIKELFMIEPEKLIMLPGSGNMHIINAACRLGENRFSVSCGEEIRLLFIGKDRKRKNLDEVISIGQALNKMGKKCTIEIIGSDKEVSSNNCELEIKNHGYLNPGSNAERITKIISRCHFTCLFSRAEGGPRSNIESYYCGTPVLTHNIGGIESTFIEGSGHLFDYNSTTEEKAIKILEITMDGKKYEQHRRNAVDASKRRYSWRSTVDIIANEFR